MDAITLPALVDSLDEVTSFVSRIAAEAGLEEASQHRFRLAAEEIVTNIVTHGYAEAPGGPATGKLRLEGGVDQSTGGRRTWIRFIDDAPAFDPTRLPAPDDLDAPLDQRAIGGLGIYLVRSTMDEFTYRREDGRNILTLALHGR